MKKIFTLISVAMMAVAIHAQTTPVLLQFTGEKNDDATEVSLQDTESGFAATFKSTKGKIGGDGNKNFQHPDEVEDIVVVGNSWKPGQPINGDNASVTVTIPSAGTLSVYARTSGDDKDLCIVITQEDKRTVTLVKNTKNGAKNSNNKTVFDFAEVKVVAGTATIETFKQETDEGADGYNCANANIFGLGFKKDVSTCIGSVEINRQSDARNFNLSGQQVTQPTKGIFIKNGRKYITK